MALAEQDVLASIKDQEGPVEARKTTKKRKRANRSRTIACFTVRNPPWAYLHLKHYRQGGSSSSEPISENTVSMFVDAAAGQFLGLHGKAIPMDILKLDAPNVWVRIPNLDRLAFTNALAAWTGRNGDALRVVSHSSWSPSAQGRDAGQALFND